MNPPANQRPQLVMKTVFFFPASSLMFHSFWLRRVWNISNSTRHRLIMRIECTRFHPSHTRNGMEKKKCHRFFFFFFSFFRVWGTRASSSMNETGANGVADRSGLVSPMRNFANLCAIFFKNQKFNAAVSSSDSNVAFRSENRRLLISGIRIIRKVNPLKEFQPFFFFKLC